MKREDLPLVVGVALTLLGLILVIHHSITAGRPFDLNQFFYFIPICHGLWGLALMVLGGFLALYGLLPKEDRKKILALSALLFLLFLFFIVFNAFAAPTPENGGGGTAYLEPNGDVGTSDWHCWDNFFGPPTGNDDCDAGHWTVLDDEIRQPEIANGNGMVVKAEDSDEEIFQMTSASIGSSCVSEITIWGAVSGIVGSEAYLDCSLFVDGAWTESQELPTAGWKSVTFAGSWNQQDIDDLQVKFVNRGTSLSIDAGLSAFYAEITYAPC